MRDLQQMLPTALEMNFCEFAVDIQRDTTSAHTSRRDALGATLSSKPLQNAPMIGPIVRNTQSACSLKKRLGRGPLTRKRLACTICALDSAIRPTYEAR